MKDSNECNLTKIEKIIIVVVLILFIPVFIASNVLLIEAASYSIELWKSFLVMFCFFTVFISYQKFSSNKKHNIIIKLLYVLWFVTVLVIGYVLSRLGIHINYFFM